LDPDDDGHHATAAGPARRTGPAGDRMTGRRWAIAAVVAVVVLLFVAIGAGWAITGGLGGPTRTAALGTPRFTDVTAATGIDSTYDGPYPFAVGGGVAALDCDADGRPDLYLAGGSGPATLYRNDTPAGGGPHFTAVHDPATDLKDATGAYPLDIDGDGVTDLVVLRIGGNVILRGLGDCRFERANEALGFEGGNRITMAFSATWEGQATLPTLAFGNYVLDPDHPDPDHLCADNVLVRPAADGRHYDPPIPLAPSWCAQSVLFSDWDRSGRRDLRISNDRQYYSDLSDGQDQLWRMDPGQAPRLYTADDGWVPVRLNGMGIGSYDVNGDGYPDAYLTSQGPNVLQTLLDGPSKPAFRDVAGKLGVAATRPSTGGDPLPSTSWHPEFADVNNDGFIDLFVSKGNVATQPDYATKDPSDLFIGQPDGTFATQTEAAGIVSFAKARGAALVDLDGDGLLDLVVVNVGEPTKVWRNLGGGSGSTPAPMGHWIGVKLTQAGANRDAIGAWVDIEIGGTTIHRELTVGGGHVGGQLLPIHVGLGPATTARVRVTWPDGTVGPWEEVKADQVVSIG
jgi:hypothetical protein